MSYETDLAKEFYRIGREINKPDVSEETLDKYLEIFSKQLSALEESKGEYYSSKLLLRNLKAVQDNKKFNQPTQLTEEQKIIGAIEKIQAAYKSDRDMTSQEIERKVQGLQPYLKTLEGVDLDDYTIEDEEFISFLQKLLARGRKGTYKVTTIRDEEYKPLMPTHERFTSYFNDTNAKRAKEVKNKIDEEFNTYYEMNLLVALKNNGIADQSELNRIKSLGMGKKLSESIKAVIPRVKHDEVKKLHQIQEDRYKKYLAKRERLI